MLTFTYILIAMYYLQSRNLVHRHGDISYTNILLRSQGKDSSAKKDKRREIMEELGLSDIETLRDNLGCRWSSGLQPLSSLT